jgi:hypothetical protein
LSISKLCVAVEKVVVNQANLGLLSNKLLPGSYQSVSRIDFKALDQVKLCQLCSLTPLLNAYVPKIAVKPKGIYGNKSEIAKFLQRVNCVDEKTSVMFLEPYILPVYSLIFRYAELSVYPNRTLATQTRIKASALDYISFCPLARKCWTSHTISTLFIGQRIQPGMTKRYLQFHAIGLHSCG